MDNDGKKEQSELNIYSNSVHLNITFYDFKFNFGKILPDNKHVTNASVYMSPQHTKILYLLLKDQIEKYEDRFSEIVIPEEMTPKIVEETK